MKVQLDRGPSLDLGEISESQGKRVKSQKYLAKKKALLVKSMIARQYICKASISDERLMGCEGRGRTVPYLVLSCY